jgi:hypothetical protein
MHTRRLTWSTLAVRKTVFSKGKSQSDDVGRSIRCEVQACRSQGCRGSQILEDQLTLSTPGGQIMPHHISTDPHGFSDLPTALKLRPIILLSIFGGLLPFYETTTFDKNNVLDLVPDYGAWNGSRWRDVATNDILFAFLLSKVKDRCVCHSKQNCTLIQMNKLMQDWTKLILKKKHAFWYGKRI